jgi:phage/plasmid-like protein (TIGR03299 family)
MVANIEGDRMAHTSNIKPWWGIGRAITDPTDPEKTLREAGMDFVYVVRAPMLRLGYAAMEPSKYARCIVAVVDGVEHEVQSCGTRWMPHQPADIIEFYRQVAQKMDLRLETAGVLGGFTKIWAMARVPKTIRLIDDVIHPYVSFVTGIKGMSSQIAGHTNAIVCQNTMEVALRSNSKTSYDHRKALDVEEVVDNLNISRDSFDLYELQINKMAGTKAPDAEYYFNKILLDGVNPGWFGDEKDNRYVKYTREMSQLKDALSEAPGQDLIARRDNVYGLFNAVTYWTDHSKRSRGDEGRVSSILGGESKVIKHRAWEEALRLVA